jgi:hypothetical protein
MDIRETIGWIKLKNHKQGKGFFSNPVAMNYIHIPALWENHFSGNLELLS